ncbi:negative elongation factor A [Arctopsyche grandis]|uniref:negative elongation factor A n=1 Tax=Arctopsyche grandis TaxID=121162 RepID=UPI00406D95F2
MSSVRDSDTSLWLHNKLGAAGEPWSGGSICPQLTQEVLRNVRDCFPDLHTHVKLKLLLSFLHLPRRNVDEWRNELEEIMEVASVDSELWVSMLSEILKTLPSTGSLNTHQLSELDEARPVFGDMVTELKRLVNRHSELAMLPMECIYLNKNALVSVVGQQPNPVKHFTLKRKPKSAALRAELLQKSTDALSNMKKPIASMVPVRSRGMPRKMTDTTPLKGLPSRFAIRGNNSISQIIRGIGTRPTGPVIPGRKDGGGIKLLDIADQPATHTQKKRRRMLELEEQQKKAALEAEAGAVAPVAATPPAVSTPAPAAASSAAATGNQALPEYARGLNNYVMPSTPSTQSNREQGTPTLTSSTAIIAPINAGVVQTQPSTTLVHTPKTPHIIVPTHTIRTAGQEGNPPTITTISANATSLTGSKHPIIIQQGPGSKPIIIGQQQKVLITGQPGQKPLIVTAGPGGTILSGQNILKTSSGMPVILTNSVLQHATQNAQGQAIIQGGKTVVLTNVKQMNPGVVQHGITQQGGNVIIQTQQVISPPTNSQIPSANPTPGTTADGAAARPQSNLIPRRGLSLTRDQMLAAQDMFKNANRVTRPEKALILGFMAGSRDNPCPNLGNIVTIKLSENQENVLQRDDTYLTMLCETHFQMNYNNGQWMRIKKYRPIDGVTPQPNIPQQVS